MYKGGGGRGRGEGRGVEGPTRRGGINFNHATLIKLHLKIALGPSKLQISMVVYVCIEESFDTIFNIGGLRKSAMDERVKQ